RINVPYGKAYERGNTKKGYWCISKSLILHRTLGNSYWESQGLKSLQVCYEALHYSS
ncbi:group II intron reverse transcriptase/maturase, partial [Bacillus sp. SIMBA_005]